MLAVFASINAGIQSWCHGGFLGDVNMCRGWKGLALMAAFWCLYVPARAQVGTYPSPVGAARMPEPIPCAPSQTPPPPQPNLMPGPISSQAAPMGPPDSLSLPYDHTSAFQCENYVQENGLYFGIGPMALQRNHLGAGDIAVVNARAVGIPTGSVIPNPFLPTEPGVNSALNFNSVTPALSLGLRGTAGYLFDNNAIEFSAFYVWQNDVNGIANQPLALDTLFYNPPLNFVGQGLFRRTDLVQLTQGSSLFNAEANYIRWNSAFAGLEFIIGGRYIRQNDELNILTAGTNILGTPFGQMPPTVTSNYSVLTHNNIGVAQIGAEYNLCVCRWLTLAGMGKAGWGANYLTTNVAMNGLNGVTAFSTDRHATVFSQVYELGAFAYINFLERLRLRLGYTSTWLLGVATSVDQVDFNLKGSQAMQASGLLGLLNALATGNTSAMSNNIPHGRVNNNGSLIYFGPQIELQFFW
jgi:hypothetical protein